jgi:hypothetical protein
MSNYVELNWETSRTQNRVAEGTLPMQNSLDVTQPLGRQHPAPSWEEAPQPGHYLGPDSLFLKKNWQLFFQLTVWNPEKNWLGVCCDISTIYIKLLGGQVSDG